MEKKKKSFLNSLRRANSLVHTLRNIYDKAADDEFREFGIMEYGHVQPEEVTDIKRLRYLKKLQLAKNGYIENGLKNLLARQKQKQRLMDNDAKVIPIGQIKVMEGEWLHADIQIGYGLESNVFKVAYRDHENILKWKDLDNGEFVQHIVRIHPNRSDNLQLEHTFFENNLSVYPAADLGQIQGTYNHCVSKAFHGNRYFRNAILRPDEGLLENPGLFIGKQFQLQLPKENIVVTLSEANAHYMSFRSFLMVAPKPETYYFTTDEFKRLFLDSQIELVAKLKFDLLLGVKEGILHVGRKHHEPSQSWIEWNTYDSIIKTSELPMKTKYYLCKEIIMNKNFVVEKDAVQLENQNRQAFLKKHYKTGKWHFAEIGKSSEELHFRPLDPEVFRYIQDTYSESKNFGRIEKQVKGNHKIKTTYQMR